MRRCAPSHFTLETSSGARTSALARAHTHVSPLSPPQVLYSNDRLSDDSAVVEAEKARKQENERDKEHKRIRCRLSSLTWPRVAGNFSHRALTINSNEAKIKAIQAKLALMKKEAPPASSDAGGKQPSSYSARNPSLRDRPY